MGNIARIKKRMNQQPIALGDSKVAYNHCRILLGHPNPNVATKAAAQFGGFMQMLNDRARQPNFGDLYKAHFEVLEKIKAGEEVIVNN